MKVILPLVALALGVLVLVLAARMRPETEKITPKPQPSLIRVEEVESRTWQFVVRTHGSVSPRSQGSLIPEVSGTVVWVSHSLESGGFFESGEPLLRIDRADYEVGLETAKANLARGESEYKRAQKELSRQHRLAKSSVASDAKMDDAVNREHVAGASLREARARLTQAERDLSRTEIQAPYAGRVRSEEVDVGQFVKRGDPIARIYAVDFAEVRLPIPDAELYYLDIPLVFRAGDTGPVVRLNANFAGADRVWQGRVVRTEGEIDAQSRMVHVVARVEDPYHIMHPESQNGTVSDWAPLAVGLFVEAEILGRTLNDVFVLPRSALRDGDRVLVVDSESKVYFRSVEVLRWERDVVVIGAGLETGERVCVSPMRAVVEGMEVRVAERAAALSAARENPVSKPARVTSKRDGASS